MTLSSPAIKASADGVVSLSSTYTCDGKNTWPEFNWQGVPPGTAELALFVMSVQPLEGKLFFDWAVAGLDPGLARIEAGRLPEGAATGRNGFGKLSYSICPGPGTAEEYIFALYALPKKLSPSNGFDPRDLRKEILGISGNTGVLAANYARR